MDELEIERDVQLILTASEYSQPIQERIRAFAKMGMTHQSFKDTWKQTLKDAGFEDHEIQYIAPWIETWADEVYSKVEKEDN